MNTMQYLCNPQQTSVLRGHWENTDRKNEVRKTKRDGGREAPNLEEFYPSKKCAKHLRICVSNTDLNLSMDGLTHDPAKRFPKAPDQQGALVSCRKWYSCVQNEQASLKQTWSFKTNKVVHVL